MAIPQKLLREHDQVSGVAQQHLQTLLLGLKDHLLRDGWTGTSPIERDLDEVFSGSGLSTTYGFDFTAAGVGEKVLTVYAGFATGFDVGTSMVTHDFGLKLVHDEVVLFEASLQAWQGTWSQEQMDALLAEALSLGAGRRLYQDMAESLTP